MTKITTKIFESATMRTSEGEQTLSEQLIECKAEGWSLDTFEGYLLQFFEDDGLREFLESVW